MPPTWTIVDDETASRHWDDNLLKWGGYTPFQWYAWGAYKRSFGWEPLRFAARNDKREIVAQLQCHVKRYGLGVTMVWSSGGPVGDIGLCGDGVRRLVAEHTKASALYFRLFCNRMTNPDVEAMLIQHAWRRSRHKLRSGLTMTLRLDRDIEAGLTRNWRRNLRRFCKQGLTIREWPEPDFEEMLAVYDSMQSHKNIKQQFSLIELQRMYEHFGDRLALFRCDRADGRLVALRGYAFHGRFGWDWFAATSVEGRRLYASYGLLWAMLEHCRGRGVTDFDLMGIDPDRDQGVYNFKKGTGADHAEYLGEWEWCSSRPLAWAANLAVRWVRSRDECVGRSPSPPKKTPRFTASRGDRGS